MIMMLSAMYHSLQTESDESFCSIFINLVWSARIVHAYAGNKGCIHKGINQNAADILITFETIMDYIL